MRNMRRVALFCARGCHGVAGRRSAQISWQAQRSAAVQGQVQISGQAQHLRKAEYRLRGRRSTCKSRGRPSTLAT